MSWIAGTLLDSLGLKQKRNQPERNIEMRAESERPSKFKFVQLKACPECRNENLYRFDHETFCAVCGFDTVEMHARSMDFETYLSLKPVGEDHPESIFPEIPGSTFESDFPNPRKNHKDSYTHEHTGLNTLNASRSVCGSPSFLAS